MKEFIKSKTDIIVKLMLNQFGALILGLSLSLAAFLVKDNPWIWWILSLFSVGFYVYLLYSATWESGAKDIIKHESGRGPYYPWTGLIMGLIANIPNLIVYAMIVIGKIFGMSPGPFEFEWAGNLYMYGNTIFRMILNPMYFAFYNFFGTLSISELITLPFLMLPLIISSALGYYAGLKNFRIIRIKSKDSKTTAVNKK